MLTVRRMTPDDIDAAADLTARVFADDSEEQEGMFALMRAAYRNCPFIPPDLCWIGVEDERLVVKWQLLDFQMRIAGTVVPIAGIQGVVAEPDANHKGYAIQASIAALKDIGELDFDMLVGFAQRGGLYAKIGAVPVAAEYDLELDARAIPRLRVDPFHEWNELAELPALVDHYNASNAERTGPLVRTEALWPWLVRKPPVVHMSDAGYIGVRYNEDELEIREIAGQGEAFHEAALYKLADLARERGVRRIRGAVPADHPLVAAALHYGARITTHYTKRSGCISLCNAPLRLLGRIQGALDTRLQGSRHHNVHLDLGVRCGEEEIRLAINADARSGKKIDIELEHGAIQQMCMGYKPVRTLLLEHARETGSALPVLEDESLDILETLFPQGHPFMWQTDRY
jgi:hypothetical protein